MTSNFCWCLLQHIDAMGVLKARFRSPHLRSDKMRYWPMRRFTRIDWHGWLWILRLASLKRRPICFDFCIIPFIRSKNLPAGHKSGVSLVFELIFNPVYMCGTDMLMRVSPYLCHPTRYELLNYFSRLAKSRCCHFTLMIYRTICQINPKSMSTSASCI